MSMRLNLTRPDFPKYNFGKDAPAVQEPIVSLPLLFHRFRAQDEANQLLIELDQGRVGTSLRQIEEALAERRLERQRCEQGEEERHRSSHQQAATTARAQKQSLARSEVERDEARAREQEEAARNRVQERVVRAARREDSLQALQSRVEECAKVARLAREKRTFEAEAGLLQDQKVRQAHLSGRIDHTSEVRPRTVSCWAPNSSHVSRLAEMGRVFYPEGRKR